ncbi:MAG: hypothetical protein AVDCRST_MAG51-2259, partial [uncultured Ramlibacter sp.]
CTNPRSSSSAVPAARSTLLPSSPMATARPNAGCSEAASPKPASSSCAMRFRAASGAGASTRAA